MFFPRRHSGYRGKFCMLPSTTIRDRSMANTSRCHPCRAQIMLGIKQNQITVLLGTPFACARPSCVSSALCSIPVDSDGCVTGIKSSAVIVGRGEIIRQVDDTTLNSTLMPQGRVFSGQKCVYVHFTTKFDTAGPFGHDRAVPPASNSQTV